MSDEPKRTARSDKYSLARTLERQLAECELTPAMEQEAIEKLKARLVARRAKLIAEASPEVRALVLPAGIAETIGAVADALPTNAEDEAVIDALMAKRAESEIPVALRTETPRAPRIEVTTDSEGKRKAVRS